MKRTNKISITGTVKGVSSSSLEKLMLPFLDNYEISKYNYRTQLHDDGDNLLIDFNDSTEFGIHFEGCSDGSYLLTACNENDDIGAKAILLDIIDFFKLNDIVYNIEIQYEYDNGD